MEFGPSPVVLLFFFFSSRPEEKEGEKQKSHNVRWKDGTHRSMGNDHPLLFYFSIPFLCRWYAFLLISLPTCWSTWGWIVHRLAGVLSNRNQRFWCNSQRTTNLACLALLTSLLPPGPATPLHLLGRWWQKKQFLNGEFSSSDPTITVMDVYNGSEGRLDVKFLSVALCVYVRTVLRAWSDVSDKTQLNVWIVRVLKCTESVYVGNNPPKRLAWGHWLSQDGSRLRRPPPSPKD